MAGTPLAELEGPSRRSVPRDRQQHLRPVHTQARPARAGAVARREDVAPAEDADIANSARATREPARRGRARVRPQGRTQLVRCVRYPHRSGPRDPRQAQTTGRVHRFARGHRSHDAIVGHDRPRAPLAPLDCTASPWRRASVGWSPGPWRSGGSGPLRGRWRQTCSGRAARIAISPNVFGRAARPCDQARTCSAALRTLDPPLTTRLHGQLGPADLAGSSAAPTQGGAGSLTPCGALAVAPHGPARLQPARTSQVWADGNGRSDAPADEYGST